MVKTVVSGMRMMDGSNESRGPLGFSRTLSVVQIGRLRKRDLRYFVQTETHISILPLDTMGGRRTVKRFVDLDIGVSRFSFFYDVYA